MITPSFNNITGFQAILAVGAEPVFCDIVDETLCIDLDLAEELVSSKTKAIIVMDYDCVVCDHDRVKEFAAKHNIRVIHDAAHSFGSKYKGKKIGSFSDITMFSFDPVKTVTCIDGGMLVVNTPEELQKLQEMRLVGMGQSASVMYQNKRAWTYDVNYLGFRYHMANLHAAIGLAQLAKMEEISATRRAACRYYNKFLSEIPGVIVPKTDFAEVTPFLYYIRVPEHAARRIAGISFGTRRGHGNSLAARTLDDPFERFETRGPLRDRQGRQRNYVPAASFQNEGRGPGYGYQKYRRFLQEQPVMKGRDLLNSVKAAASVQPCLGIPVGKPVRAFLRPVITASADEASEDVYRLSIWRNKFVTAFLDRIRSYARADREVAARSYRE